VNRDVRKAQDDAAHALTRETEIPRANDPINLDARIAIIHGDEIVASNHGGEPFDALEQAFARWIDRFGSAQ